MTIEIGRKIAALREKKGVSQDELAKFLGIPIKDLIHIENGNIYPPVELIPTLADYFDVTTDELLCMERFDHEEKINSYIEKFQELVSAGDIHGSVDLIREALIHYPDNYRLKYLLLYGLYLSCDRPSAIKHYSPEILAIYGDISAGCTDDPIRIEAKRVVCLHLYDDLHDTERARQILRGLPGRINCREDMLPNVSEGESKLKAIQANIISYTEQLTAAIEACAGLDPSFSPAEKTGLYELARNIRLNVFPEKDFFGMYAAMMETDKQLAVLYMAAGRTDDALDTLDEAARFAAAGDALTKAQYASPLVKGMKYDRLRDRTGEQNRPKRTLRDIFLTEIVPLPAFEPVRYDKRIKEICDVFISRP